MSGPEEETVSINIRDVPRDLYFNLQQHKARLQCESWRDFLQKVNDLLKEVPGSG